MTAQAPKRRHGTRACYQANKCRRPECVLANARYRKAWSLRGGDLVDAQPVRAKLLELLETVPLRTLARRLDCNESLLRQRVYGYKNHKKPKKVKAEFVEAVLNLRLWPLPGPYGGVLAVGSLRRIEALEAQGLTQNEIALGCGIGKRTVGRIVSGVQVVNVRVHEAIRAYYETNWSRPVVRYRSNFRWLVPGFAWEEGSIDDPDAEPQWGIAKRTLATLGRFAPQVLVELEHQSTQAEQLRVLHRHGATRGEVCAWLGFEKPTIRFYQMQHLAGINFPPGEVA